MKRFILCSLSATVALAAGTVARADMYENTSEMTETDADLTEGIISPDSQSPNNRAVPGAGVNPENTSDSNEDLVDGVISPDSQSPNNRAVPGQSELDAEPTEENPDLTDGIISPDSQSPNNREVPGNSVSQDMRTFEEAYQVYQETGDFSLYEENEETAPTDGIISPDSQSPNNRAVPGEGALESDDSMMDNPVDEDPTDGIISPDSNSPDNRVEVEREPNATGDPSSEDLDETDGIIVPDSDSPNNREVPGMNQ